MKTQTTNPFEKIIFLFGPTSVGKTNLLSKLDPNKFSVINADSIQVYKGLDIGSAKVTEDILKKIDHYMIDILDPREQFTVATFIEEADKAVKKIHLENKIPVISGGTAFYFKHFLYGLSNAPASSIEIRKQVETFILENSLETAYAYLEKVDPISHNRINQNDKYRISRALEVYLTCNKPLSSFDLPDTYRNDMNPLIIGLYREKEIMDKRLRLRFDIMMKDGLLDEIRYLVSHGANESWPGMQGIGYKEFFQAMKTGELTVAQVGDLIVHNSRKYAKRQYTFFKSFKNVNWMNAKDEKEILTKINDYI
ncbi:MAG: tRNA (adenosine(37)-N6)-dimethylallyltransferase MiaA [Pleomorphochaeta sp.]